MRSVSAELAAAIEAPERVARHCLSLDWDEDGWNGTGSIDDLSDRVGTLRVTQQLATQLPEQVRVVAGAASAQLDVDLARGNVFGRAIAAGYEQGSTAGGTGTAISIAAPAGAAVGEYVVLFLVYANANRPLPDLPKGGNVDWTLLAFRGESALDENGFADIDERVEGVAMIRRIESGEPADYTFTAEESITWMAAAARVGAAGIAGLHAYSSNGQEDGVGWYTLMQNPPVDVYLDGTALVAFHVGWLPSTTVSTTTATAGATQPFTSTPMSNGNLQGNLQYRNDTPAGRHVQTLQFNPVGNLVPNPDFETDLTGWNTGSPSVGTITRSNEASHRGDYSMKIVPTGADTNADGASALIAVTPGAAYAFSAWVMTTVPRDAAGMFVDYLTAGDVFISSTAFLEPVEAGVWTKVGGTLSIPGTAAKLRIRMRVAAGAYGNPPSSMAMYADEIAVKAGSVDADVNTRASIGFTVAFAPAIAGDDAQHAAWTFSELNPGSPYAGKNRLARPTRWEVEFATTAGFQGVPVFTGLSLDAGGSSRGRTAALRALDNRETWREPAGQWVPTLLAEFPNPVFGSSDPLWPGLDATFVVSWLFLYGMQSASIASAYRPESQGPSNGYAYYAMPGFRDNSCMLYAPMHGSAWPFIGQALHAYQLTQDGAVVRCRFGTGPYVAATEETAPAGLFSARYSGSGSPVGYWADTRQTAGRIEHCVRLNLDDSTTTVDVLDGVEATSMRCRLQVTAARQLVLTLTVPGGVTRTVNGPTIADDGAWHWVGVHWDSVAGSATFAIDAAETVVAFSTFTDSAVSPAGSVDVYVTAAAGAQIAEVHVDGGVGDTALVIAVADPWLGDGFTPTAFIDKSWNELDGVPAVDPGLDAWEIGTEVAAAEYAALFWDADGYPHFRTVASDTTEVGQTVARELTATAALKDLDYVSGVTQVRNSITVGYSPIVLHVGEPVTVDGLWRVPAYQTITIPVTLPGVTFDAGVEVLEILTANTRADGTGTAVADRIFYSASFSGASGSITVTSDYPLDLWLVDGSGQTSITLVESWYQQGSAGSVTTENAESIRRYRRQPLPIGASPWRQRLESAYQIADRLASDLAFPRATLRNVKIVGDPRLELGDLVRVVDEHGLAVDDLFRLTGLSPAGSTRGGFEQAITARAAGVTATWDGSYWDDQTVWGA